MACGQWSCRIIRRLAHYTRLLTSMKSAFLTWRAGDNVLPTTGMADLECKVGQIKVTMTQVVICALDLNVLSSYSLHEQGWEARLGTLKIGGLYHKKIKFP